MKALKIVNTVMVWLAIIVLAIRSWATSVCITSIGGSLDSVYEILHGMVVK